MTALATRSTAPRPLVPFARRLYAPMVIGAILNPINSSMIAVSLVPIGIAFGASSSRTAWLVSGLYLATAIGQPVVGRMVDRFGPRAPYLVGTALAGVAGLLGAFAPTLGVLVVARVLLGFGTCAGYPSAMALIKSEARRTGKDSPASVLTVLSLASQTITVVGPTLGGLLVGWAGWRSVFLVNVPLALAAAILGTRYLPRPRSTAPTTAADRANVPSEGGAATQSALAGLDVPGMVLFAGTLVALLLYGLNPSGGTAPLLGVAAVVGAVFAWWELRSAQPFFDLRLLGRNPALLLTYVRQLLAGVVSYTFVYGYSQWLQAGYGLSPSETGLLMLPMFGVAVAVTALTGRHAAVRAKLLVGSVCQVLAGVIVVLTGAASPLWLLVAAGVVVGIPQGLVSLANQNALYAQVDGARIGSSAGLLRTFVYLGAIGASAATGVAFRGGVHDAGLHTLGVVVIVASSVFLVVALVDRSLARIGHTAPIGKATA
ncbi:MAG TPA: MFS transporter [Cellulomonas sp.]